VCSRRGPGTVTGFTFPGANLPVKIMTHDEVHILFGVADAKSWSIDGSIE
jgi:hypothetical protein